MTTLPTIGGLYLPEFRSAVCASGEVVLDFRTRPCIPTYHDGRWFDNDAHQKAHDHATGRTPLVNDGLHDEAAALIPGLLETWKAERRADAERRRREHADKHQPSQPDDAGDWQEYAT